MGMSPSGIAFNQFTSYVQEPVQQSQQSQQTQQTQGQVQGRNSAQSNGGNSLVVSAVGVSGGNGTNPSSLSGCLPDGSIGHSDKGASDSNSSSSNSGHSAAGKPEVKDELFLFEGLRLDGDAPEFEPKTQMSARGW